MPSKAILERFDAIFPLQARPCSARLPVKMKNELNLEQSKASQAFDEQKRANTPSSIPVSSLIPISTPLGGLLCDVEFRKRELGTSQNQAISFEMSDDGLNFLHYEDVSILV